MPPGSRSPVLAPRSMEVVGQAESPQEAIDGVLSADPDVVVLDVQLQDAGACR